MKNDSRNILWKGVPLSSYSKDELIEIIEYQVMAAREAHENFQKMAGLMRYARETQSGFSKFMKFLGKF